MKKIISAAIIAVMLCAFLSAAVSADVLWKDDFNNGVFNEKDWTLGGTLFYLENGGPTKSPHIEGWAEAVVQQSTYGEGAPAPRVYGANVAFKCDSWFYDDGGNNSDVHWVGLWWADYFADGTDPNNRIVYMVRVNYESRQVILSATGVGEGEAYFSDYTEVSVWDMPDSEELVMDITAPTVFNMGIRINGRQIDGFYNNKKVVSYTAPVMGKNTSPLLFWNNGCYTGFDNWIVSTADYDLFGEGSNPVNNDPVNNDPAETETEKRIETKVVHETNEAGEDVTVIVTEEVVVPVANTGRTSTGTRSSSKTGDAAIIVIAVMIAALGGAIVLKRMTSKPGDGR